MASSETPVCTSLAARGRRETLGTAQIRCRGRGPWGGGPQSWPSHATHPTLSGFHNVVALMHVDGNSPRSPQAPGVCPAPHRTLPPARRRDQLHGWTQSGQWTWSRPRAHQDLSRSALRPPLPPAALRPPCVAALAVCTLFILQRILHDAFSTTHTSTTCTHPCTAAAGPFRFRECVTTAHLTLDSRIVRFLGIDAQGMNSSLVRTSQDESLLNSLSGWHLSPRTGPSPGLLSDFRGGIWQQGRM